MLRHKNFTKLLGYCQTEKQLILISEYMPNKTLADKLEGTSLTVYRYTFEKSYLETNTLKCMSFNRS